MEVLRRRVQGEVVRWVVDSGPEVTPAEKYIEHLERELASLREQVRRWGGLPASLPAYLSSSWLSNACGGRFVRGSGPGGAQRAGRTWGLLCARLARFISAVGPVFALVWWEGGAWGR